jgi:hypothetical protein
LAAWGLLFLVFWTVFWRSGFALFAVAIATVYAVFIFSITTILARVNPERPRHPRTLKQFAAMAFQTRTGAIAGGEAVLQIVLVPLVVSVAAVAIGVIISFARLG